MRRYWGTDLMRKRRDEVKDGDPWNGWAQQFCTWLRRVDGGWRKYLLGEDFWIINNGGAESLFLSLEEVV